MFVSTCKIHNEIWNEIDGWMDYRYINITYRLQIWVKKISNLGQAVIKNSCDENKVFDRFK